MNKVCFLTITALFLFFSSCSNSEQDGEDPRSVYNQLELPTSQAAIFEIVNNVEEVKDTLIQRGPIPIIRDSVNIEVVGYYQATEPVLVHAKYPEKEEWYFLLSRKVIMLKELISNDQGEITENQFFYNNTEVLAKQTRKANNKDLLQEQSFSPITQDGDDYRFSPIKINNSATDFIYGK